MTPAILTEIIKWTIDSALEAMSNGDLEDGGPEMDVTRGLWQSFRAKWPEATFIGDYDLAVTAMSTTYRETMIALVAAVTPADPIVTLELDRQRDYEARVTCLDGTCRSMIIGLAQEVTDTVLKHNEEVGCLISIYAPDDDELLDQYVVVTNDLRRTGEGIVARRMAPPDWLMAFPEAWSEIPPAPRRAQR